MVVVSDLGPPEEGVRHTQPAVATFVNRFFRDSPFCCLTTDPDQEVHGDGNALHLRGEGFLGGHTRKGD